jgi:hypothetical protein
VEVFSALLQPPKSATATERVLLAGESSCFYHPNNKAVVPCDSCGRFLCPVCEIELSGQHLCPRCLESGKKKGQLAVLENQRTLYDSLALQLAVVPLIIFWATIITAPIAIYLAIRHWNAPRSIVSRSRWRLIVALIVAGAQVIGWGSFFFVVFQNAT